MEFAGLSFVGLGAAAPSPEWGAMMNDGRPISTGSPDAAFPCILIGIILLVTKFGDALRSLWIKNINHEAYLMKIFEISYY